MALWQVNFSDNRYMDENLKHRFHHAWLAYQAWYLDEGEAARPTYLQCIQAIKAHMPELYPTYKRLTEHLDANDLMARFLSLYNPPIFYSGCSQLVTKQDNCAWLIRNYDFPQYLFEGQVMLSQWNEKKVLGMTDCLWGILDGINEDGLACSLNFGGHGVKGEGFGITIVLRYLLETCSNVEQAINKLKTIPVHLDYTLALVDTSGEHRTVYLSPGNSPVITNHYISANHQVVVENEKELFLPDSIERLAKLEEISCNYTEPYQIASQFLQPPLYRSHQEHRYGTLYTSMYDCVNKQAHYIWPGTAQIVSFDNFNSQSVVITRT